MFPASFFPLLVCVSPLQPSLPANSSFRFRRLAIEKVLEATSLALTALNEALALDPVASWPKAEGDLGEACPWQRKNWPFGSATAHR